MRLRATIALLSATVAPTAAAQSAIEWVPADPGQGSFVLIVVRPDGEHSDSVTSIGGALGGEPLHFQSDGSSFRAIGGIPINAGSTIPLTVTVARAEGPVEHRFVRMPVRARQFPSERLSVDPRYSEQPDSVLAVRIADEARRARTAYRASHERPRLWSGPFELPVHTYVTSEFGTGRVFNGELTSRHMGVDYEGRRGDPIHASNRGVVALTGHFYYGGNSVYIDHGAGVLTVYLHMSQILVNVGDTVETGQVIGLIGATGRVTGPHLHWIGKYGKVTVDPRTLLTLDVQALGDGTGSRR